MSATTKLSISLPADLADTVRALAQQTRDGNLSALVADALQREVRRQESIESVAGWEAEHGVIGEDELAAARRWLD